MNENDKPLQKQSANDHLANERTLLAWIRTAIAIMAFGFVVVKFSLFLKQVAFWVSGKNIEADRYTSSSFLGIGIVVVGALTMALSYVKYKKTERQLLNHQFKTSSRLILILILIVSVMSVFLILYLIETVKL